MPARGADMDGADRANRGLGNASGRVGHDWEFRELRKHWEKHLLTARRASGVLQELLPAGVAWTLPILSFQPAQVAQWRMLMAALLPTVAAGAVQLSASRKHR